MDNPASQDSWVSQFTKLDKKAIAAIGGMDKSGKADSSLPKTEAENSNRFKQNSEDVITTDFSSWEPGED